MFILEPKTIALIGASAEEGKVGNYMLKNLMQSSCQAKIYPVNPKHSTLLDIPCFASVVDIPDPIDMAVVVTPARTVVTIAEECGKKGVKTLVVISAGFGEVGAEGKKMEEELGHICQQYDMSLAGPNCLGILRPSYGLNASFAKTPMLSGAIALVSQSGAIITALLDEAEEACIGFSSIISMGNKTVMDECKYLEIFEHDSQTKVIGIYVESIQNGREFTNIAKRITKTKPIVLLKAGVSVKGATSVASHTGALAGSDAAVDAACTEAGIHRANNPREFLEFLSALATQPLLLSDKIAIITNAGGIGVLATDATEKAKLCLPSLHSQTLEKLHKVLPKAASTLNPIDVLGDAGSETYKAALSLAANDENIDGIACFLTPQVMTPVQEIARVIIEEKKRVPLMPIVTCFMGGAQMQQARTEVRTEGIPCAETPHEAIQMLSALRPKNRKEEVSGGEKDDDRCSAAHGFLKMKKGLLSEDATSELLSLYGLGMVKGTVAKSAKEAVQIASSIGYPVIAKISSPDIVHKTDIGGVRTSLNTPESVEKAYEDIIKNVSQQKPLAAIDGIFVQQFLPIGNEFIIGGIRDASFGPLILVGLGGIYTELLRDTSLRLAPLALNDAYDMLVSLRSWKLLQGLRGHAPLHIDKLAHVIYTLSTLLHDCTSILSLDCNPVLVSETDVLLADVKVIIDTH